MTPAKIRRMNLPGAAASVVVVPQGVVDLQMVMSTQEKVADLRTALARALNTWEMPPSWLIELSDLLESKLPE